MIIGVPEIVFGNMRVIKRRNIIGVDADKRIRDIRTPGTQSLDFRSREDETGFVAFAELVIPRCLRITNFGLFIVVLFFAHLKKIRQVLPVRKACPEIYINELLQQIVLQLERKFAFDNFAQSDIFWCELFERIDERFHAFVLKLVNATRNDVDQNVRVFNDFVSLSKIFFSHVDKMIKRQRMADFQKIGKK